MRSKNMNLDIAIKASFSSLNSEKKKSTPKKSNNASILSKPKSKKENSNKKKIKNIIKKDKFFNKKLTKVTSFSSNEKRKIVKLSKDFFNKKKITSKKNSLEKDSYSKINVKRQLSNKSNTLNKISSKNSLLIKIRKNPEKKFIESTFGKKLIKPSAKSEDTSDKKKISSNLQKNIPNKKKKKISPDLTIILNKRNYKLGKVITQSEKALKNKKNKIIKNFIALKKNLSIMEDKENKENNSQNGNEKKEVDEQIELQENKEINITKDQETDIAKEQETDIAKEQETDIAKEQETDIAKDQEADIAKGQEKNMETNQNINVEEGEKDNKEKKEELIQDTYVKEGAITSTNLNINGSENLEQSFSEGAYEPSNDIFNENYQKVPNTLLPGYTISECEGIYKHNNEDAFSTILELKKNGTYIYKNYFPSYNYIPHLNNNPLKEAYYLRKHEILNNYIFTSADIMRGTIHEQNNMVVAYPYGVPVIDIKKK